MSSCLPRKRKKSYIKAHSLSDYRMMQIVVELLFEEGESNNRFYTLRQCKNSKERMASKGGFVIVKKW